MLMKVVHANALVLTRTGMMKERCLSDCTWESNLLTTIMHCMAAVWCQKACAQTAPDL